MGFGAGFIDGWETSKRVASGDSKHIQNNTDENDHSWSYLAGKACGYFAEVTCDAIKTVINNENHKNQ